VTYQDGTHHKRCRKMIDKQDWGYTKWTWHFLEQFTAWHHIAAAPSS
jgi:hypothetical protein